MRHPGGRLIPDRNLWFERIERLYARTGKSTIPCHQACPDLLCETGDAEQVLFLPYELTYIQGQMALTSNPFESVLLDGVSYGYMSGARACPYFQSPDCLNHDLRPFDCRSFPILPRFTSNGSVAFHLSPYCPLSRGHDPHFTRLFTSLWKDLAPHLPEAWKAHYNSLYRPPTLIPLSS